MTKGYLVVGIILKVGSRHEHITHLVCWNPFKKSVEETSVRTVIADIKSGSYYFTHYNNYTVNLEIGSRNGVEYVKTEPDGSVNDNLLKLPTYVFS